jgi:hypothetical protein
VSVAHGVEGEASVGELRGRLPALPHIPPRRTLPGHSRHQPQHTTRTLHTARLVPIMHGMGVLHRLATPDVGGRATLTDDIVEIARVRVRVRVRGSHRRQQQQRRAKKREQGAREWRGGRAEAEPARRPRAVGRAGPPADEIAPRRARSGARRRARRGGPRGGGSGRPGRAGRSRRRPRLHLHLHVFDDAAAPFWCPRLRSRCGSPARWSAGRGAARSRRGGESPETERPPIPRHPRGFRPSSSARPSS